jgi:hypothetical protein
MKVSQVLRNAADLIEQTGWCVGQMEKFEKGAPSYCAVGAILKAKWHSVFAVSGYAAPECAALVKHLKLEENFFETEGDVGTIITWNDYHGMRGNMHKSGVVAAMRACADDLDLAEVKGEPVESVHAVAECR